MHETRPDRGRPPVRVRLRTGDHVWVRPIARRDAQELQRAFALLSDLSRYRRFFTGTPSLSDKLAEFFSDVDHVKHEALVAAPGQGSSEPIVGVARYVRREVANPEADLAITVADTWQGRGLGTELLRLLSDRARSNGVRRFTVDMLADNAAVQSLVSAAGGRGGDVDGEIVSSHIDLAPPVIPLTGRALLRTAARAHFVPLRPRRPRGLETAPITG